jgi:hypothetical protein
MWFLKSSRHYVFAACLVLALILTLIHCVCTGGIDVELVVSNAGLMYVTGPGRATRAIGPLNIASEKTGDVRGCGDCST